MPILIASGTNAQDIARLNQYNDQFSEGDIQELVLSFSSPIGSELASTLASNLYSRFSENYVDSSLSGNDVIIHMRVGVFPVWTAIGVVVLAVLVVAILFFVGWTLYKVAPGTIAGIPSTIILIGAGVLAAALLLTSGRNRSG